MSIKKIGVVGMAVMGKNLAINMANNGYLVSIYNRSPEKTNLVISKCFNKNLIPYYNIEKFASSLQKPRCILLMVKAGVATDDMIHSFIPYLEKGDILIDGGNSFYKDTIRRHNLLEKRGIFFIGAGVSGGEEGALKGPSIMPGGNKKAYLIISPLLKKIAAHYKKYPCVDYIGPDGAGHYVKMIHNGIEYADMQLISEAYFLLKLSLKINNEELSKIFNKWNKGELKSYLIEITKNILCKKDENNNYVIDSILDIADNKGTGKWASKNALDLGEPLSIITESVFARYISSIKNERKIASKILSGPKIKMHYDKNQFIENIRQSLFFSKVIAYNQGFLQLKSASKKNNWNLNYSSIAKLFRSGCIIQADFLHKIVDSYVEKNNFFNLLLSPFFKDIMDNYQYALRKIVAFSVKYGIPVPGFSSAITYYDSYRAYSLPTNLIQAQRDYFGAHKYQHISKNGYFHTEWKKSK